MQSIKYFRTGLVTAAILLFHLSSLAETSLSNSTKKCSQLELFNQEAACITTKVIKSDNDREKRELFAILIRYWNNKDGTMGFVLSNRFLDILEKSPDSFFSLMYNYPNEFDEWLARLNTLSFTWYDTSPSPLPARKARLIEFLEKTILRDTTLDRLRTKLLEELESIVPHQIE